MAYSIIIGNPYYLILSIIIMCFASYTMLNMIEQLQSRNQLAVFNWIIGGASVFGLGLWTMHVVSLLASDYRLVMNWSMLFVLLLSTIMVYVSLRVLKQKRAVRGRYLFSALLMALGTSILQYMSMLSESTAGIKMNWLLYMLSFGVSFLGAYLAFYWLAAKTSKYKLKGCLSLGLSNMALHQIGLHALKVEYRDILSTDLLNEYLLLLAFLLGLSTLIILSFSLTTWLTASKYSQMNERYRLLVENSMDTIALINGDSWEFMNRAGLNMFEVESEKGIIGTSIYQLLDEKYHFEMEACLSAEQSSEEASMKPIELQWKSQQGTLLHTEMVRASSFFSGKQIVQVIIRDISERKKNEELLINSEKLYVAGQLAAGIAHEIRNPLTSLKGFLQLITTGRGNSSHFYDIMKSELERIETIVSELLMLSKPQSYELVHHDSGRIMEDTVNLLQTQAILHGVTIEFELEARPLWVLGVESQLKQVFINLLKNAIESMHSGGVVSISMSLEEEQGVIIRIKDEGSGIGKEQLAKIGQPFYTTKDKGTGLGLMVTYKIIDNHHGQITAESVVGVGTTFIIKLPYKEHTSMNKKSKAEA
ncbi:hypothetical protein BK133_14175 [Paenibacillus sp. FSL H8-0548]|uniref:ATP-binding protein n=1 Tax=Paenibacillus sp. FSL H8-0548 TaxID=1920422 RepID=UPI00096E5683|nr:ATP-binding protein [Paenibacillus sp. FSL H8-0548]OMF32645.1 hypothetical protein BK133_14175 [Paenibacillus sp. FSL H8-0548]